jgi:hypothetical protein
VNSIKKIIFTLLLICIILVPINTACAFNFVEYLEEGESIFFLVALRENESLSLKVNHEPQRNFTLFLFDNRPVDTHVNPDLSLDSVLFTSSNAYNVSDQPKINFNSTSERIYYIQLILIKNGSSLFTLTSNRQLSRYYLPQIPGYHILVILSTSTLIVLTIIFKKRKLISVKQIKNN